MYYLIRAECGDYYCGCGGGHVLAVTTNLGKAKRLKDEAEAGRRIWKNLQGELVDFGKWHEVSIDGPYAPNKLDSEACGG